MSDEVVILKDMLVAYTYPVFVDISTLSDPHRQHLAYVDVELHGYGVMARKRYDDPATAPKLGDRVDYELGSVDQLPSSATW